MADPVKVPYDIKAFGGINASHTRKLGQSSDGKNFWTRNGSIVTREGSTAVAAPAGMAAIKSIHSASKVALATRLLVQEGTNLRYLLNGNWATIKNNLAAANLDSVRWLNTLVLVNGTDKLKYNIDDGSLSNITDSSGSGVPEMERVAYWRFKVFTWAPNKANSNQVRFCGYDGNGDISLDYWPADFMMDIGGESGTPLIDFIPFGSHTFCLTTRGYKRVYGTDETNFEVSEAGNIGVYGVDLSALVGEMIIFVGSDKKVYSYTGTAPRPISQDVDELLIAENYATAKAYSFGGMFWLFFGGTKAYVFNTYDMQWYIHIFPYTVNCATGHGDYLQREAMHFGLSNGTLAKLDETVDKDLTSDITTEFEIGPFDTDSRKLKVKRLWLGVDPKNDFDVNIYAKADRSAEAGPYPASFTTGSQTSDDVKISGVKGQNVSFRVTSTDRINEIQKATLILVPKEVK